jgi:hypothetical protein
VFGNQQALQPDDLKRHAVAVGSEAERFATCLDSSRQAEIVR